MTFDVIIAASRLPFELIFVQRCRLSGSRSSSGPEAMACGRAGMVTNSTAPTGGDLGARG